MKVKQKIHNRLNTGLQKRLIKEQGQWDNINNIFAVAVDQQGKATRKKAEW